MLRIIPAIVPPASVILCPEFAGAVGRVVEVDVISPDIALAEVADEAEVELAVAALIVFPSLNSLMSW